MDDQPPFREAARRVVEAMPGFAWAGEAGSGAEAIDFAREHRARRVLAVDDLLNEHSQLFAMQPGHRRRHSGMWRGRTLTVLACAAGPIRAAFRRSDALIAAFPDAASLLAGFRSGRP